MPSVFGERKKDRAVGELVNFGFQDRGNSCPTFHDHGQVRGYRRYALFHLGVSHVRYHIDQSKSRLIYEIVLY